jgi:hypothetical protein
MTWEEICGRCKHLTTIGYPDLMARGEGRCTGYDGAAYQLKNPFVTWNHRVCVHFTWASPMAAREPWIKKQQEKEKKNEVQPETKG